MSKQKDKKTLEEYKLLAEAREFTIDTILKPAYEILTARGIVLSMLGDLTLYAAKNGRNNKYTESMERLTQLDDFLNTCNKVNDHNYQLRIMLNRSIQIRDNQQQEIDRLNQQIEATAKALNAE